MRLIAGALLLMVTPAALHAQEETTRNASGQCLEPPPMIRWDDYQGPLQKVVGIFARKLERRSAHQPARYKPGTLLCSMAAGDKFALFVQDTFDPVSFLSAGFNAGLDQASDRDPAYGQGAEGYGKRFGSDFAGATASRFFSDFAYPTLFREDPRYYRLGHGSVRARLFHAAGHTVIAHRDDGSRMFNFSLWLGTGSAIALGDLYHPGNPRGLGPAVKSGGIALGENMGFDMLREFWPEIAHKLHMPFRDMHERVK